MVENGNIDVEELEKFSSRANQWWDADGEFKTLHDINPVRLNFVTKQVSLKNLQIMDIGCGGGILTEAMAKQGAIVTGLDASKENIEIASQHATDKQLEINYVVSTAESFAEDHIDSFDVITCMELLEHVPDPASIIQAANKMVKPGGHVFFSTINRNIKAYILAVLTAEYLLKLLPQGTHQYEKFIKPSELVAWCQDNNLVMNDLAGLQYNPLTRQCSLNLQPDVNYLLDTIAKSNK
ncbi:MAG: ubiquinone biosynthesis O-methyltransferase [marine bacterium B5-7]|nr:MAG: ubiquinone biosynthesis O-methyltransferase [marine bacterium B5-7]